MSPKDQALIDHLRRDGRASVSALARGLGLSRSTVQDRLTRLEDEGVIAGYTVRLGEKALARQVRAVVMIKLAPRAQDDVAALCRRTAAVHSLHTVAGEYDLVANLVADDTEALDRVLDQLGRHEGIERTQTSILLSLKFKRP